MSPLIWGSAVALAVLVLYGIYLYLDASTDVKNAPRDDMYVCDRHGPFPRKYVMKLDAGLQDPVDYCPFCFEDKMKEARRGGRS